MKTAEITTRAEQIQKEFHEEIDAIMLESLKKRGISIDYQSAFNTWLFMKLAKLELMLEEKSKSPIFDLPCDTRGDKEILNS